MELREWTVFDGISVTPGEKVLFASEQQIVGSDICGGVFNFETNPFQNREDV